jgi:hypothetical protein
MATAVLVETDISKFDTAHPQKPKIYIELGIVGNRRALSMARMTGFYCVWLLGQRKQTNRIIAQKAFIKRLEQAVIINKFFVMLKARSLRVIKLLKLINTHFYLKEIVNL